MDNPLLEQQYRDGQLIPKAWSWIWSDPHMTYKEFEERADCHFKRLRRKLPPAELKRRQDEFAALCKQHPRYWKLYFEKKRKK